MTRTVADPPACRSCQHRQRRAAGAAATTATAPACDGVICFAGVDWWYHNRGHNECQIMRRLAARTTVLWINSIGMRTPGPGRAELWARRCVRKLGSTLKGLRRDPSGMWVYSPLFIPRYSPRAVALNGALLNVQVRALGRALGLVRPAAWITVPTAAPAVLGRRFGRVVFNRADEFSAFPEVDADLIRPLEQRLIAGADHVLYVNRRLEQRERGAARQTSYLGHGVDASHFSNPRPAPGDGPWASALSALPRPIIGFYGALDDYTIDLDLLVKVARRFRHGSLALIGPQAMRLDALLAEPNVRYLGPLPYQELPAAASRFDVGLMPWLQNRWIAGCNPIKLKEYLALGFPIASTPFPELEPYAAHVHIGATHAGFLGAVERALAERDDHGRRTARQRLVADDGWDVLARRVATVLGLEPEGR